MRSHIPVEQSAVDLVIQYEESGSYAAAPRQDPVGNWEIGYGSIWDWRTVPRSRVTADTPNVDQAKARMWLAMELQAAAEDIAAQKTVPLTDGQAGALEDLIYNIGQGAFNSSTLLRYLNCGDYKRAAAQFALWNHAGGKVLAGLTRRRQAETKLFNT